MDTPMPERNLEPLFESVKLVAFDFDGVFTDNRVYVFQGGREAVVCNRSDGIGLRKLDEMGIDSIVVSTEPNPVVSERCEKLKIECHQGIENKLELLKSIVAQRGISLSQVAFVGNDINDLDCLKSVALPIVVRDAHPDVIPYALYRTVANGGAGAVREVCDIFERSAPGASSAVREVAAHEE